MKPGFYLELREYQGIGATIITHKRVKSSLEEWKQLMKKKRTIKDFL